MLGDGPSPKYGAAPIKAKAAFAPAPGAGKLRFGPRDRVSPEQVIESVGWSGRRGHYQHFLLTVTCVTIASEAAEVALLSLILPHIRVEFGLTSWETDKVAMSIFAGQMLGCFVMGSLADAIGRKPCSIIANVMVAVGGYASALAPGAGVLMACRFAVGLGVGAAFVPVDMLAEACPERVRDTRTQLANLSFSVGVVLVTIVGAAMLEPGGWRLLAFVTALPPTLALAMTCWLDESPTWLAERGRSAEAKRALDRICAECTGHSLPRGVEIVSERELKKNDGVTRAHCPAGESGTGANGSGSASGAGEGLLSLGGAAESLLLSSAEDGAADAADAKRAASAAHNLAGTPLNFFRTVCLWTLAFVQTFNFYGLMLNAPVVFRRRQFLEDGVTEDVNRVVFDYAAILIVNSGDVVGNFAALAALRSKVNPRWVAGVCAAVSIPLLFVPLSRTLSSRRWGLVLMMLVGRVPAAPIGAMSWILNAVAYPTLFRATGHGWANAVARFGAVAASSMYSAPAAVSIPVHAVALVAAVPAAIFMPAGSLETTVGAPGRILKPSSK
jgi:MFS family permease